MKKGSLLPRTVVKDCLPPKGGSGIAGKKVQNGGPRRSKLKQSLPGKPQCFIPLESDSGTSPVAAEMAQFKTGAGDKMMVLKKGAWQRAGIRVRGVVIGILAEPKEPSGKKRPRSGNLGIRKRRR